MTMRTDSTALGASAPARWQLRDGVAWMLLDAPGKRVNTLSTTLMRWLGDRLDEVDTDSDSLRGLVIRSEKPETFIAGADIEELRALEDTASVRELLREGHALANRVAALPFPVVAAVHGACLGGGLELALVCDWRVATDHPKTKIGFPEVQLGIFPGLGGTQRTPRLIGVPAALDLVLTGRQISARRARRLGLVDETCHPAQLDEVAASFLARGKRAPGRSTGRQTMTQKVGDFIARTPLADRLVYEKARESVMKKTGGHYPAPLEAIEVIKEGMSRSLAEGLDLEAEAFVKLVTSETAKNLMGIFFMKNDVDARAGALAANVEVPARAGVLGAGLMGAGITQVLAHKGVQVTMKDRDVASLGRGMKYSADLFAGLRKRRRYDEPGMKTAIGRIHPTVEYASFEHLDFVIEAVFEEVGVKRQVIAETEAAAADDLVFASNTSTIPIATLAEGSARPERVVGMHFFSPVHKMPLLEIIRHPKSADEAIARTVAVGKRMGKTIIVVDDGPGFFTSRVLGPYVQEAVWCLVEGATIEQVDQALTAWGWPVGALTLLDEVGLDVGFHAGKVMFEHLGERLDPPAAFERMIEDGRKGRKSGRGFYRYDGGKRQGADEGVYELLGWSAREIDTAEIQERCWLQMLNEVARAMEDGVISNPVDVEIGVIFGLGFPPFRGGILKEADRRGLAWVVERLEHYAGRYGRRLEPADRLRAMADADERFH